MELVAVLAVPIWILLLPLIMFIPLIAPSWLSKDELWLIWGPPAWMMLPFSGALWWIIIRRLVFHRPGGFIMPWVVWLLTAAGIVLWRMGSS